MCRSIHTKGRATTNKMFIYLHDYRILVVLTVDDQLIILLTLALQSALLLPSEHQIITSRAWSREESELSWFYLNELKNNWQYYVILWWLILIHTYLICADGFVNCDGSKRAIGDESITRGDGISDNDILNECVTSSNVKYHSLGVEVDH